MLDKWNALHHCKNVFVTDGACMTSTGNQSPSILYMTLTARAAIEVRCARIDAQLFHRVAGEYPEFGQAVLAALSQRLNASVKELEVVRSQLTRARSFSSLKS